MAERKIKSEPVHIRTMEQLLRVVDDVITLDESTPIELRDGRRVHISPEAHSIAVPANGVAFTAEEIERRRAIVRSLFGAWSDIDADAWKAQIRESRGSLQPSASPES